MAPFPLPCRRRSYYCVYGDHDIIHNAPGSTLEEILTRQGPAPPKGTGIGGIDLTKEPTDQTVFDFPFSQARVQFMQMFYLYVQQAKPNGFETKWSDWIAT